MARAELGGVAAGWCSHVSSWWPPAHPPAHPLPQALLQKHVMLELLAQLKHLYWWMESMIAPTSWHLAHLITWTTCLASHLLQVAFEHTAQLAQAQAQQAEPQGASRPLYESPLLESLATKARPVLPERGIHGE